MNKHSGSLLLIHNSTCYVGSASLWAGAAWCTFQTDLEQSLSRRRCLRFLPAQHWALGFSLSQEPRGCSGLMLASWITVFIVWCFCWTWILHQALGNTADQKHHVVCSSGFPLMARVGGSCSCYKNPFQKLELSLRSPHPPPGVLECYSTVVVHDYVIVIFLKVLEGTGHAFSSL